VSAATFDPTLQQALEALAPAGVVIGHRVITAGDENALTPEEAASISSRAAEVRRASGAARIVARQLMARLGLPPAAVPKETSGMPIWPAGLAGSIAHTDGIAVAALARTPDFRALGIDIEPALPLPADMRELVVSPREWQRLGEDPLAGRVLFAAKEAAYKAAYPLDRVFLEFADIEVDLRAGQAQTRTGRTLSLRHCVSPHIVALALA
jgi:4'-phosphopantetheinyl transferase EntD